TLALIDDRDGCFAVGEVNHQALFGRVASVVCPERNRQRFAANLQQLPNTGVFAIATARFSGQKKEPEC
ncbi:MAG: hypothetical protein M3069_32260, partial [Chloroflexota bacterium]|nr:hypothetical protein [Chloroflexota bacterium]